MSIEAINWAMSTADVTNPTEAMTLQGLANHADKFGRNAWPSVATLAEYVRVSERTIHRTLRGLEERGVIRRGNQGAVAGSYRGGYLPVVYDIPMGKNAPRREVVDTDDEGCQSVIPSDSRYDTPGTRGVTPVADEPPKEPSFLTSRRAPSVGPNHRPQKTARVRRMEVPDESPSDTGRLIGMQASTDKVRRTKEQTRAISRPDSGGGLAMEFGIRAKEAGLSGPQEINGAALARSLTRWMTDDRNPDTPQRIRVMMDRFFEQPGGNQEYPLWRRFISEAPRLRNTERKSEPIDYAAAAERQQDWLKERAALGDIRAERALSGENKPWLKQEA